MARIGRLIYLNCAPVYYGIDVGVVNLEAELIPGVPSKLNRMLAEGKLDVSPISAIEYARHQNEYKLLPNLCLNSEGMVKSVLLVSKFEIEKLQGKKIALTNTSATSQALLKILFADKYHFEVEYREMEPQLEKMLKSNDAALLIGDDALTADFSKEIKVYDIGQLWREYSGFPVIFVVFAARMEYANSHPEEIERIGDVLYESLMYGLVNIKDFGEIEHYKKIAKRISMQDYFANLNFELDKRRMDALLFYYAKAAKLGLCSTCKLLQFTHLADAVEPGTNHYKPAAG